MKIVLQYVSISISPFNPMKNQVKSPFSYSFSG